MPTKECCDPEAPIRQCIVCGIDVYTCEMDQPDENSSYVCPAHPDGIALSDGDGWVCSVKCWYLYREE